MVDTPKPPVPPVAAPKPAVPAAPVVQAAPMAAPLEPVHDEPYNEPEKKSKASAPGTVKVGSRLTMNLLISTDAGAFTIIGVSHPLTDGMAVTEDVPADLWHEWLDTHAAFAPVASQMLFELPADYEVKMQPKEYGHEPALKRMTEDPDQQKLAEQGAPDDPEMPLIGRAGMEMKLPDPLPEPPKVQRNPEVQAPPVPGVIATPKETAVTPTGGRAMDDPKNDLNMKAS